MTTATIYYHEEPDGWWAESPDFPSFFAAADTYEDTKDRVREALHGLSGERHLGLRHLIIGQRVDAEPQLQTSETGLRSSGELVLR